MALAGSQQAETVTLWQLLQNSGLMQSKEEFKKKPGANKELQLLQLLLLQLLQQQLLQQLLLQQLVLLPLL
jgi:hypothetical protein